MRASLRTRSRLLESLSTTALGVAVAVVALAFAWPWLPRPPPGGAALNDYLPLRDGAATLFARLDASGEVEAWVSQNRTLQPWLGLFGEIRKAPSEHLLRQYSGDNRPGQSFSEQMRQYQTRGRIVASRARELDRGGRVAETMLVSLRDERGELLVGLLTADNTDLLYDPPALLLPADLGPERSWHSEGRLGTADYRLSGQVVEQGAFEARSGRFDDCLGVETQLRLVQGRTVLRETSEHAWYCAGVGLVESDETDAATGVTTRTVAVSPAGGVAAADLLPKSPAPSAPSVPAPALGDPDEWTLTRVGRARVGIDAGESTFPPLWIAGEPPLLLVAGYAGDLMALDAGDDLGAIRWRFHPPSTIYGPPAYDPTHGRIYFGAGDRRLYAVDVRGLFLWSFETGDNVATRPLLIDPASAEARQNWVDGGPALVVFGSEDGTIYGLDGATGAERWRASAGGSVVSSPVLVGDVIAIGSDAGTVHGVDPTTGRERWQYTAGGAVEAAIGVRRDADGAGAEGRDADGAGTEGRGPAAANSGSAADSDAEADGAGGLFYVASRDGTLAGINASECESRCEAAWEMKVGRSLRHAPAVGEGRVFVIDEEGFLLAFDALDGHRLWATAEVGFVGSPALADGVLVVARKDGAVSRFDLDGAERGRWSAAVSSGPVDGRPAFAHGPAIGGGALWLADTNAVVRRLGAADGLAEGAPLRPGLVLRASQPPFGGSLLMYTPVEYRGNAVVLDSSRNVYLIEPGTGLGERRTRIGDDSIVWPIDPIVAGDTLLVVIGDTLTALDLPTGRALWELPGGGTSQRPPVVAGDTVLWLTPEDEESGEEASDAVAPGARGRVRAVGLADGAPRWQAPLDGFFGPGGAIVHDGTVFVSSPPSAFDLATGAPRWRAESAGLALGGPALDEDGVTTFVGLIDPVADGGVVAAIDTASGRLRWRADIGAAPLPMTERPWLDGDTLIVPTTSGAVVGLDAATGGERWRHQPAAPRLGSITVASGQVWLVLQNAHVVALDVRTGRLSARFRDLDANLNSSSLTQRPAIVDGHVVVSIGRMLLGFPLP